MTSYQPSPRGAKAPKAAEMIAAILRDEIVSGVVADGERLGSGPELVERFGVSRPTLREAFRILEAEDLISITRGVYGGVIARRPDEGHTVRAMATVLQSRGATFSDVYEARTVIESAAVGLLANTRSRRSTVKALAAVVDREEATLDDPADYAKANVEFHDALIGASGNTTLVLVTEVLHDLVADAVTRLTTQDTDAKARGRRAAGVEAHRRLLEVIADGDAGEAERYWRDHMRTVGRIMIRRGGDDVVSASPPSAAS